MGNSLAPNAVTDAASSGQAIYELQRLLLANESLDDSEPSNIVRVLRVQAMGGCSDTQIKVLQTLPILLSHPSFSHSEALLAQALSICFHFHKSVEAPTIHHTATATMTQLITLLFDRVEEDACRQEREGAVAMEIVPRRGSEIGAAKLSRVRATIPTTLLPAAEIAALSEATISAYLLLHDLCLLSSGDRGTWLRGAVIPRSLGMELVEYVAQCTSEHLLVSGVAALLFSDVAVLYVCRPGSFSGGTPSFSASGATNVGDCGMRSQAWGPTTLPRGGRCRRRSPPRCRARPGRRGRNDDTKAHTANGDLGGSSLQCCRRLCAPL